MTIDGVVQILYVSNAGLTSVAPDGTVQWEHDWRGGAIVQPARVGDGDVLLAEVTGMSTSHFRAGFRESAGVPVHQYVIERRIEHARILLRDPELSVAEIALASGFTHQSHLARHLQRATGHSPLQMRRLYADHLPPMAAD